MKLAMSCIKTNMATLLEAIPAKVLERIRAMVTALQREDERHQCTASDQAVLQQLQSNSGRRELLRGDAGVDHGGDQERGADELGERAAGQTGHATAPSGALISAARFASASVRAR